jgi:hypothetical protein
MSAMGSTTDISLFSFAYQLDFRTPGSSPASDMFRKQMRHKPNLRKNALDRPQMGQRLYALAENFGLRRALTMSAVRAKTDLLIF